MKRTAALLLCLALAAVPAFAGALTLGDFEYEVMEDRTAVVTRWLGTQAEPEIPGMLDGHTVVRIGEGAFRDSGFLVKPRIPENIQSLGALAFYNCALLSTLSLPGSLKEIGDFAFAYCSSLRFIVIPEGTRQIGEYAFGDCPALIAAVVPASVSQIGPDAFFGAAAGFTLYGSQGSAAQAYALEKGIPFAPSGDAPVPEAAAAVPAEAAAAVLEYPNMDDEPAGWAPAPETLSGLWLVTTTYESWHGEDGVEKEWNLTWSSPVLLELDPEGSGTWTQVHEWGTLSGPASYTNGRLKASLEANGPSQYDGKVIMDGAEGTLEGTMTEESHTDTSLWTKGPWSAVKLSEPEELALYRDLKEGAAGKDVAALKTRLFKLGYFRSDPGTDYYTDKTADAIKAFEEANGLPADGIADPVMQALFYSDFAVPNQK